MTSHYRVRTAAVTVSIQKALLEALDAKAASLGLNRSQYVAQLVRRDILSNAPMTLAEQKSGYGIQPKKK